MMYRKWSSAAAFRKVTLSYKECYHCGDTSYLVADGKTLSETEGPLTFGRSILTGEVTPGKGIPPGTQPHGLQSSSHSALSTQGTEELTDSHTKMSGLTCMVSITQTYKYRTNVNILLH